MSNAVQKVSNSANRSVAKLLIWFFGWRNNKLENQNVSNRARAFNEIAQICLTMQSSHVVDTCDQTVMSGTPSPEKPKNLMISVVFDDV